MKRLTIFLLFLFSISIFMLNSCRKEEVTEPVYEAFSDPSDYVTSRVLSNIPRITYENGKMTVYISVTNQDQEPIYFLNKNNFGIDYQYAGADFEAIKEYSLQSSGGAGIAQNFAAALTMDYSGSMYWDTADIPAMEAAVKYFIKLKNYYDAMEILKFDHNIYVASQFTTDSNYLLNAVDSTFSLGGSTAFYAAVNQGLDDANAVVNNLTYLLPAVIGFTDGVNNQPPLTPDSVIIKSLQYQIPIFTIGYNDMQGYADTATLHHIADTTGGRFFWCPSPNDLQQLYQYVNGQLTNVYVVSFPFTVVGTDPITVRVNISYECGNGQMNATATKTFMP